MFECVSGGSFQPIKRRMILMGSGVLAALPWLPSAVLAQTQPAPRSVDPDKIYIPDRGKVQKPLNILVMGGTVFVGPAVVKAALARGHKVTIFNRGQSNPALFPSVERLKGDRTVIGGVGLNALKGRQFDCVVDTWADAPKAVEESARLLKDQVKRYLYVSSISVYDQRLAWHALEKVPESAPLRTPRPDTDPWNPNAEYGGRKKMAEDYAAAALDDKLTIVRPHQIYGYHIAKYSAGQRYWPMRFVQGGEILVPGDGEDNTQFIDVGDLAAFIVRLLEDERQGVFNTMNTLKWRDFASQLSALSPQPPVLRWADHMRLREMRVRFFSDMPVWVPRQMDPGFMGHDATKAIAAGLTFRSNSDLWRDIVGGTAPIYPEGYSVPADGPETPISAAREREVLAQLRQDA